MSNKQQAYKVKGRYESGEGRCPICNKFVDQHGKEVVRSPGGLPYHLPQYCFPTDGYAFGPRRLRIRQHSRNARLKRQSAATYY